ncbi:MarR family winged helix-turn-helix transcriptional regulator [Bacillus sp. V59.32b]|uniref:MarR family winged helix-turn-helix transcriptional regulator n=1 Tax=Bacillus sp. V59.32b TaxID=1758642 RepID=UPI000E3B6861|nr:MarR family transcriptional regulator [Bacillus sp. V59.32b]RFU60109.1 MarR family transcriptional regulator [Bacillus sp. V59.32b]
MATDKVQELIDRYLWVSFHVWKMGESLIKEQISDDLTNDQHYTLRFIRQKEKCTSTDLADAFNVNKSAITAIMTRLTDKGLIQRTRDKNDRRFVYLTLTKKGNELFIQTEQKIQKLVESFITKFDNEEIASFIGTYEKLSNILIDMNREVQVEKA